MVEEQGVKVLWYTKDWNEKMYYGVTYLASGVEPGVEPMRERYSRKMSEE